MSSTPPVPPPLPLPPLPPPIKSTSANGPLMRSSAKITLINNKSVNRDGASRMLSAPNSSTLRRGAKSGITPPSSTEEITGSEKLPRRISTEESYTEPEIVRNDVSFFDEGECTDANDEFSFPCCVPPYSPRYPPNPRPRKPWDPSVLPTGTNIPDSLGAPCRRCGREVYLAEMHLSSRGAYHSECYMCCLCGKSLDSWSVAEYKGEVFCKGCYRRNFGTHGTGFGLGAGGKSLHQQNLWAECPKGLFWDDLCPSKNCPTKSVDATHH